MQSQNPMIRISDREKTLSSIWRFNGLGQHTERHKCVLKEKNKPMFSQKDNFSKEKRDGTYLGIICFLGKYLMELIKNFFFL